MGSNYYTILEIEETATQEEIKSAFRKLAKKYHPDNQETGNEQRFKEVMEAYNVLSDLEKRKNYDRNLKKNSTTSDNSSNNRSTSSQTTKKQYTSYTKTREESEYDLDSNVKEILKKYRKILQFYRKEEFIPFDNLNINGYNLFKDIYRDRDTEEKHIYARTLRR